MFVDYDDYSDLTVFGPVTESDYERYAPVADLITDHWTLGRIGRASADGEELPDAVKVLYVSVVESLPSVMKEAKGGDRVKAFSNGVDSFTFEIEAVDKRLRDQVGWLVNLLPVEWVSACVPFEGGLKYAG